MSIPSFDSGGHTSSNGAIGFNEGTYGTGASDLWRLAPVPGAENDIAAFFEYVDDFFNIDTTNDYTNVGDTGFTVAASDAVGGALSIVSDADNNDEIYTSSKTEFLKFAASKPLFFEARVTITEGATDAGNFIVGVSDTVGADTLLDDGAGPAASYDGAVFFKVDGGTVWQFETSNAGTQVTNTDVGTRTSGTAVRLGFVFDPADGTTGSITPYVDGVAAGDAHSIALAGLENMHVVFGAKAGGANAETIAVDYVRILAVR